MSPTQAALSRKVAVVGVGTTHQGVHPGKSDYQLGVEALRLAMADAGIENRHRIDGVLGYKFYGAGIDPIEFCKLVGMEPRVTGYLDYGTGGFTTQYAAMLIATGVCNLVACVFARNPAGAMDDFSGLPNEYDLTCGFVNAGAVAALGWTRHMARYGSTEEALGHVFVAARKHAALNPIAAFPDRVTLAEYLAAPYVLWPFRGYDICKVTAGAVALIFSRADRAGDFAKPPVYLLAVGRQQTPRMLEAGDQLLCFGMRMAAEQVYDAAGLGPADVDALFISDASTAAVIHTLENYGFCGEGDGQDFVKDGGIELGGRLPINTNGGQLGEGYLVGWLHHAELVRQLRGECGHRQVSGAEVAQYCTTGRFRQDSLSSIYVRS